MDKLCKYVDRELDEIESKIGGGGKLSGAELEYADKLAHLKKSILTNEAMEGSHSGRSYNNSYKRDRMGRFSREASFVSYLEDAMDNAPDEHSRKRVERLIDEIR